MEVLVSTSLISRLTVWSITSKMKGKCCPIMPCYPLFHHAQATLMLVSFEPLTPFHKDWCAFTAITQCVVRFETSVHLGRSASALPIFL